MGERWGKDGGKRTHSLFIEDLKIYQETHQRAEVRKWLDQLTGKQLNDENLMKARNCQSITVTGYVVTVCTLGKRS